MKFVDDEGCSGVIVVDTAMPSLPARGSARSPLAISHITIRESEHIINLA
jgi:hypothetical protein